MLMQCQVTELTPQQSLFLMVQFQLYLTACKGCIEPRFLLNQLNHGNQAPLYDMQLDDLPILFADKPYDRIGHQVFTRRYLGHEAGLLLNSLIFLCLRKNTSEILRSNNNWVPVLSCLPRFLLIKKLDIRDMLYLEVCLPKQIVCVVLFSGVCNVMC